MADARGEAAALAGPASAPSVSASAAGVSFAGAPSSAAALGPAHSGVGVSRVLAWFSCGAASAIATKLTPEAEPVYCETRAEHADNARFFDDCERWFERKITRLHSERYADTWEVWSKRRYLAGVKGALCTVELKLMPRLGYQRPDDVHVLGYTADPEDVVRAKRMRETYPEQAIVTPLIERGLTKRHCLELLSRAGIALPPVYALGFRNNNCIPCVKAQSPAYWALIRKEFPAEFERLAKLSRELKVRLVKTARGKRERIFIDEVPLDQPTTDPIQPACDFLCRLAEQDLG
jgi:hypothetical protein